MSGSKSKNVVRNEPMKPIVFVYVANRKRFNTDPSKSVLIAGDDYSDGSSYERGPSRQQRFLYKAINSGQYFVAIHTRKKLDTPPDVCVPLNEDDAISHYENMPVQRMTFEEAFPGVEVEDL